MSTDVNLARTAGGRLASDRVLLIAILCSLLIHAATFLLSMVSVPMPRLPPLAEREKNAIQVQLEVVDSLQESSEVAPETAQFASDRNLVADEETSPTNSPTNVISQGQQGNSDTTGQKTQPQQRKKLESFSLSTADQVALNDPLLAPSDRSLRGLPSQGFVKRLKQGEALKVNAFGLDYGQYYIRMRERLAQRWEWRRALNAEMQSYRKVAVEVGVVLNSKGQLEDIQVTKTSFFPEFDEAAIEAFKKAEPFPNPPSSLIQDDDRVYVPWAFILTLDGFGRIE